MMHVWKQSYARRTPVAPASIVSAAVHALLIGMWIVGTQPAAGLDRDSLANRIFYIPPPDRPPLVRGSRETVHYITLSPGVGDGPGEASIDARRPITPIERSPEAGTPKRDSVPAETPGNNDTKTDSVFTVLQVDTAVARSQSSAAPAYPLELLSKHIEGAVIARYVVDTTGFADVKSFEVMEASNPGFVDAVREALPYMRFSPAKIGTQKVRQLVEQRFGFRIAPSVSASVKPD
ncbi:MAG TPA: energy transducer TonB [Gemmatimonadaceae bacterium]|nr:energy transducer TonB [Gemmatimonadaceae bacterium]